MPEIVFESDDKNFNNPTPVNLNNQNLGKKRRVFFCLFAFVLFAIVCWFLWREFSYIYSLRATVMGDLINYKSPEIGHITKIYVKNGQKVSKGELLFELETNLHEKKLAQLHRHALSAKEEIAEAERSIEAENNKIKIFIDMTNRKIAALKDTRAAVLGQIDISGKILDRTSQLYRDRAISLEELQIRKNIYAQHLILLKQVEDQVKTEEFVIAQAKEGKYVTVTSSFSNSEPGNTGINGRISGFSFSSNFGAYDVKDYMPALRENLAQKKTHLELINNQITDIEILIQKSKVYANVDGIVNHISRHDGDYVTSNDYILSIEVDTSHRFVAARFTTDDARYLKHDEKCKIVVPSQGIVIDGTVTSVGHSGLNAQGVVSPDDETALAETPVKIEYSQDIKIRPGQHVFVKVNRGWTFHTWLLRLY